MRTINIVIRADSAMARAMLQRVFLWDMGANHTQSFRAY